VKVGDLVKDYEENDVGIILGLIKTFPRQVVIRWNRTTMTEFFDWEEFEDLSYNRLELISESR
jgi:hypothetical protein